MSTRFVPLLAGLVLAAVAGLGVPAAEATSPPVVKVTAKDFEFVLSTSTVPHGPVEFVLRNAGSAPTISQSPSTRRRRSAPGSERR